MTRCGVAPKFAFEIKIETLEPFVDAIEADEAIPDDLRQPVVDLNNGWIVMFLNLRPKAVNWLTLAYEIAE